VEKMKSSNYPKLISPSKLSTKGYFSKIIEKK
jgi:hypothetical protein